MKHFLILVAFFFIGKATSASNLEHNRYGYGESFIFTEGPVEFAVYPNGSFDFRYLGRYSGTQVHIQTPNVNISYNAGYDYSPYLQYDDYGAVIQIEDVPIYYDFYGRIIRAGHVMINYNTWGYVSSVGGLFVHYNRHHHFSHYTGFINIHNRHYVYHPWHQHYMMPRPQYTIVYHSPYRTYYEPIRYNYREYREQPRKRHNVNYYRPGDNAVAYNRGRRTEKPRNLVADREEGIKTFSRSENTRTATANFSAEANAP